MLWVLAIAGSLLLQVQVTSGIPLLEFYPFGREAGDAALPRVEGAFAIVNISNSPPIGPSYYFNYYTNYLTVSS